MSDARILPLGDSALLVDLHDLRDIELLRARVLAIADAISAARPHDAIDVVPAYTGVAVHYDPHSPPAAVGARETELAQLIAGAGSQRSRESRLVEIPVIYGGGRGVDLDDVARHTGLDAAEVVRRHAAAEYVVAMIGFVPGFPYLAGMPPELTTPRLPTPRKLVPAGSVAIGGHQAGIYPLDSAGGWRIIGWTGARLFDPYADDPTLLRAGDRVRLVATSR